MTIRSLAAGLGLLACCLSSSVQAQTVLRFSSYQPPTADITSNVLTPWAQRVTASSNGTLDVRMFAGGTLGSARSQMQLVETGVADIAMILPSQTPGVFPGMLVAELPFLLNSSEKGSAALWHLYERGMLKGPFDKFKVIAMFGGGPAILASNGIKNLQELKGQKLSSTGDIKTASLVALGAVPVGGIPPGSIPSSIDRGLVRGLLIPWNTLESYDYPAVTGTYVDIPLGHNSLMVIMNKAKYDSLPEAARKAIDEHSGGDFSRMIGKHQDDMSKAAREKMIAKGQTVIDPSPEEMKVWRDTVQPVIDKWLASDPDNPKILETIKPML